MNVLRSRPSRRGARRQAGFILVTGMMFLVVMTLLGLALFRSSGLLDRITANTRDKQRSFEAAQSALEYGAWWLAQPSGGGDGTTCAANNFPAASTIHTCLEPPGATLTDVRDYTTWYKKAFVYQAPNMNVSTASGMANATDINYQGFPGVYVEKLGLSTDGKYTFYQLTAYGRGGDANTVSVVRGTFKQTAATHSLKKP
jgi:type IV pilus assembly protein PilX